MTNSLLPKNPRFEAYKDAKGEYRWRLRAANGLIVADSAEGYVKKANATRAAVLIRSLIRHSDAPIPVVHWEPGAKDVGGRRPGPQGKGKHAHKALLGEPGFKDA